MQGTRVLLRYDTTIVNVGSERLANISRYTVSALLYADSKTLESMLAKERCRNFIEDEESDEESDTEKEEADADPGAPNEADSTPSAQTDTKPISSP